MSMGYRKAMDVIIQYLLDCKEEITLPDDLDEALYALIRHRKSRKLADNNQMKRMRERQKQKRTERQTR